MWECALNMNKWLCKGSQPQALRTSSTSHLLSYLLSVSKCSLAMALSCTFAHVLGNDLLRVIYTPCRTQCPPALQTLSYKESGRDTCLCALVQQCIQLLHMFIVAFLLTMRPGQRICIHSWQGSYLFVTCRITRRGCPVKAFENSKTIDNI